MPHKRSQYVFDYCPKCGSPSGSVYLRQWKKPTVYCRLEDFAGMTINQRRAMDGLAPLSDQELVELNELNQKVEDGFTRIGLYWKAIASILPRLMKDYEDLFPSAILYHMLRTNAELLESVNNHSPGKITWFRWFDIADAYEKYGSYRAASRKTRFQSWDKVWHQVSRKYIKQKLPEVIKFQKGVEVADHNMWIFLLNFRFVLRKDPELNELYKAACERELQEQRTAIHNEERSDIHRYYYIRHKLEKGRKECGPFKEGEIPGLVTTH